MSMCFVPFDEGSVLNRLLGTIGPFGFIAVDVDKVNLQDLISECRPGRIVRVDGNPDECIKVVYPQDNEFMGCLAGWISEEC